MSPNRPVDEMDKNELAEFALSELAVELDLHRPVKELREEVKNLLAKGNVTPVLAVPQDVEYLKHPSNGRVYRATPQLWRRGDMIPCDQDGNPVAVAMDREEATRDSVLRAENARLSRELSKALDAANKLAEQNLRMEERLNEMAEQIKALSPGAPQEEAARGKGGKK
ncbi:MAG TPA: hypothetical protein VF193_14180 [Steroidobacter sp.]